MTLDPALPALAGALADPGAALVAHRPGRRAVVRAGDGHFVKLTRPERSRRVARRLRTAATLLDGHGGAPVIPAVCGEGPGWVRTHPLPGPALHDLLTEDPDAATVLCARAGAALAVLQSVPVPDGALPRHGVDDEVGVLQRAGAGALGGVGAGLAALGPRPFVLCHRDLHDLQVLVVGGGVGLIDLDTLCVADPALDVANLLAHLDHRVTEGRCAPRTAARAADALLTGMGEAAPDATALAAYRAATTLRLAAITAARAGTPSSRAAGRPTATRPRSGTPAAPSRPASRC